MSAIRLVGAHHTSHHEGEELTVTDSEVLATTSPHLVTLRHAHDLVARGDAEWIGEPPPTPAAKLLRQLHEEMVAAHPDRGGSNEAFIVARHRYLKAKSEQAPNRK
jgi:hypothetical protein